MAAAPIFARNRIIRLALAILFAATVALVVLVLATAREVEHSNHARAEVSDRLLLLEMLKVDLLRAESSQRVFQLTDEPAHRTDAQRYSAEAQRRLELFLSERFAPGISADVALLGGLTRDRLAAIETVLARHAQGGAAAASAGAVGREGNLLMDRIFDLCTRIVQHEITHLTELRARTQQLEARVFYLLALGAFTNLALVALVFFTARGDVQLSRRLASGMERGAREIGCLNDMSASLLACSDLGEANRVVRHYLALLFPDSTGALFLHRASRNALERQTTWGGEDAFVDVVAPTECWALRRGDPHLYNAGDGLACAHYEGETHFTSVCVPMMALGETLGLLHVRAPADTGRAYFTDDVLKLVSAAATQLASAMANLNLRAALRAQSIKDPLTGLFNRRYLEETLQREELRAKRLGTPLSIVMVDLDHFKTFNDTYGHQTGDEVLRLVADELRSGIRGEDIACRYGGEEFTLVLPGAALEQALGRAEHVRATLNQLRLSTAGRSLPSLTASLGVATLPDHGDDWADVLRRADAALYRAKQSGRNRVTAAGPV